MASDFSTVTLEARIQWGNGFEILEENCLEIRMPETFKLLFE